MSTYIQSTDITDTIIKAFVTAADSRLATWLSRTDSEILSIAQEKNVVAAQIVSPLHYKITEYAIAYFCFSVCQDVFTTNNVENIEAEKYKIKLVWYEDRCNKLRAMITGEMFTYASTSLSAAQRIGSGMLWRG